MRNIIMNGWAFIRAFALIYLCLFVGNFLSSLLPMTIPGSILGMLILFILLSIQLLPPLWLKPGCHLLIRYMALLFVPIGVGVMNYWQQLSSQFGPIVVSCVVSTLLVMVVVGYSSHYIHRERPVAGHPRPDEDK
ncbi:CidA/LrgA family protein [Acerihabitans sp. TG2]|uniref:CidA/LrgA family protein n=1 Tax=Acerihabitans sp. TG2 TaxID=3096008 RepID=UPI002B23EE4D|nr:CidA/LrgA family protein [Acerihabitans sp. TG2]MEA9389251.1 CidA/LrgA family protein [Acerihabitans sp. TG2]